MIIGWNTKREILKKRLMNSSVCPICNNKMNFGYLRGAYTRWCENGNESLNYSWLASIPDAIPSYLCNNCHLVIGQYKTKIRSIDTKFYTTTNKKLDYCPNCNFKLNSGFTFSHERTYWSKNKYIGFGKTLAWTTTWPHQKLPTKKCFNCGLFYLKYNPTKVKSSNRIAFILFIIALIGISIIVWW